MHYVLLGTHTAEVCPMSNATTKALMLEMAPLIPKIAEQAGVKIVSGPFVNREHTVVTIVEAAKSEDLDRFILDSKIAQWNSVRVLPSIPIEQGLGQVQSSTPIF
jgi:uncharacterized protein with GYD domain